ncbi:hypothetical protein C0995_002199 [Termitomyces sp. Mi166|nr:hypothetical protein C0995_002199 [Termitomyces sp. Mi166\
MHSFISRVNNVSALFSSVMMCLLAAIALSSFLFTADPKGEVHLTSIKVSIPYESAANNQKTRNDIYLAPLFHWNTKQLFLYLEAEYTNAKGVKNEVVIWDRIVRRKEDAVINVIGKNKYMFRDLESTFKNVSAAHYALKYNVMPYVGLLTYGEAGRTVDPVAFPPSQSRVS